MRTIVLGIAALLAFAASAQASHFEIRSEIRGYLAKAAAAVHGGVVPRGAIETMPYSEGAFDQLLDARIWAHRNIRFRADKKSDAWHTLYPGGGQGDCEDYALSMRDYLVKRDGWNVQALRIGMTMTYDEDGRERAAHAVLLAFFDNGEVYGLDNDQVMPVLATEVPDWRFLAIEWDGTTGAFVRLKTVADH
jgi:predicted transglutaminase-like cysteine proteinase